MFNYLRLATAFALFAAQGHAQVGHLPLKHFVFFRRDRARIADSAFVANPNITGAQIKYTWRDLEPTRDHYDFSKIAEDLSALTRHHKRLWIQLQDVSFGAEERVVPDYLLVDSAFHGGVASQYESDASNSRFVGRMARRWDPAVRARFAKLLDTLGRAFDGKIEGLNIAETAFSVAGNSALRPAGFTDDGYAQAIRAMMSAARASFRRSRVIVYANFMPGEWLPENDRGYLRGVYAYADSIGAGVGGPDLLPFRRGQRKHALRLIAARPASTIAGLAVQDGNLTETNPVTGARVSAEELLRYATDTLRLDYIFWGTEEPYYSREILPLLARLRPERVTPVGTWRGASVCLVSPSACKDEIVVYRITQMQAADSVALDARKMVGGEEQEMGILGCRVSLNDQLTCTIPQGVWQFRVRNDSLTGDLRLRDGTRFRDVRTMRVP